MDIEKNNLIKWLFVWSFTGQLPVSKRQTVHSLLNSGEVATHAQFRSISLCSSQRATQVKPEAAGVAQGYRRSEKGSAFSGANRPAFFITLPHISTNWRISFWLHKFSVWPEHWEFKGSLGYLNLQSSSRMALCFPGFRLQSQVAESCKSPQERVPTATVMLVFLKGLTGPRS